MFLEKWIFCQDKGHFANVGLTIWNFAPSGFNAELNCVILLTRDLKLIICESTETKPLSQVYSQYYRLICNTF